MASYVIVEGRGERLAVVNLLQRVSQRLGRGDVYWQIAYQTNALKNTAALKELCERLRRHGDCERALLLQDDEDGCPREDGPNLTQQIEALALPFPTAFVLFYREYETLFLPCLHLMAGKTLVGDGDIELAVLAPGAAFYGDPEKPRDAKKEINRFLPPRRPYKPTTHQLAMTRLLDLDTLAAQGPPCYGTLERAMAFLLRESHGVYPPPAPRPIGAARG